MTSKDCKMVHVSICDDDERLRLASHVYLVYVTVSIIKRVAGTFFLNSGTPPFPLQERKSCLITDSKVEQERSSPINDSQLTNLPQVRS
jgi:hypothetical protein